MKLEEKLVSLRIEKKMTQMKVAELLHVSRQAISRWETGMSMPSMENLQRLSELYGITVDDLLCDERECQVQVDATTTVKDEVDETPKIKKWMIFWACILMATTIIAVTIWILAKRENSERVGFDVTQSDDWGDSDTDRVQIDF